MRGFKTLGKVEVFVKPSEGFEKPCEGFVSKSEGFRKTLGATHGFCAVLLHVRDVLSRGCFQNPLCEVRVFNENSRVLRNPRRVLRNRPRVVYQNPRVLQKPSLVVRHFFTYCTTF